MYEEILKKRQILEQRKPYGIEVRKEIRRDELLDVIYTSLHLDGSIIKKEQIQRILGGEFVVEGTSVMDHLSIQNYIETVVLMESLLGMGSDLNLKVIEELHDISSGAEGPIWRKSNPILYTFDYNPPHWQDVPEKMEEFVRWMYSEGEKIENPIYKAVLVHNKLIEIYPFEYNSEATARLSMYYVLKKAGYTLFELRLSEVEYNNLVFEYLHKKKVDGLYQVLERNIFNKLDTLIQLTEE